MAATLTPPAAADKSQALETALVQAAGEATGEEPKGWFRVTIGY